MELLAYGVSMSRYRSCWSRRRLDDSGLSPIDQNLGDRLRERDDILFLQAVRRVDARERRQVLEDVDEHVVLQARRDGRTLRVLGLHDAHPLRFLPGRRGFG